jgi:hypothetical protein
MRFASGRPHRGVPEFLATPEKPVDISRELA